MGDLPVIDAVTFNSITTNPPYINELVIAPADNLIFLPLHRHEAINDGEFVFWTYENGRLVAKPKTSDNIENETQAFWMSDHNQSVVAFEFLEAETAQLLGLNNSPNDTIVQNVQSTAIPDGFAVSSLWPAYAKFVSEKVNRDYISWQEKQVDAILSGPAYDAARQEYQDLGRPNGPVDCDGFSVEGFDQPLAFAEVDVGRETHLFVVSKDFLLNGHKDLPVYTLCAGGAWKGHLVK